MESVALCGRRWAWAVAILCAGGLGVRGIFAQDLAEQRQAVQRAAHTLDAVEPAELLRELGSASPAEREKGQAVLDRVELRDMDLLVQLETDATNAEARARLDGRLEELRDVAALNPKLISVHVHGADSTGALQGVSQAMGVTIAASFPGDAAGREGPFTLDVDRAPFSEVMERLSREHPLTIFTQGGGLGVQPAVDGPPALVVSHGAIVGLGKVAIAPPPQANPPLKIGNMLTVPLALAADPRAQVLQMRGLHIAVAGADMKTAASGLFDPSPAISYGSPRGTGFFFIFRYQDFAGVGERVNVTGEATLDVAEESRKTQIDPATQLNQPVAIGQNVMRLVELTVGEGDPSGPRDIVWNYAVDGLKGQLAAPPLQGEFGVAGRSQSGPGNQVQLPVTVTITDAAGTMIYKARVAGNHAETNRQRARMVVREPVIMVLMYPTKVRSVRVPFEFKDVAVGKAQGQ